MYVQDAQRYPSDFHKEIVDKIVSSLTATNPLTLFAPSGFGKSKLLGFLTFNTSYRRRYPKLRNTVFAYIDSNELVSELRNQSALQATVNAASSTTHSRVVEEKLHAAIMQALRLRGIAAIESHLTNMLDNLFQRNSKLRLFVILDGMELMFGKDYELARDVLKYIRDKYRGHLDYIFGISNAKYLQEINYESLGNIASLLGQKIVYLPLADSAQSVYEDLNRDRAWIYRQWLIRRPVIRKFLQEVDRLTGGYVPYVKYFLQEQEPDLKRFAMTKELQLASERLLKSLTPEQIAFMQSVANSKPGQGTAADYKLLTEIKVIRGNNESLRLFSPIMSAYLRDRHSH